MDCNFLQMTFGNWKQLFIILRMKAEWTKFYWRIKCVQNNHEIEGRIYKIYTRPAMLYASTCWAMQETMPNNEFSRNADVKMGE